jgi:EAL domain-containing protein (putative c-di-GMP-specific phosphodiesterase class I)
MHSLRQNGFHLSIDDFGTGYSSLSYLRKFNVDKLKIDRSFIIDLANNPNDQSIVSAIIQMAHSLGMVTLAEGVETAEQLAALRGKGCDQIQGYYFSRPLHAQEFETFVRQHHG